MTDSFDPIDYFAFLRAHWGSAAVTMITAVVATAVISFVLPDRYTATATLLIDPPSANDPRGTTAVSSVYLESLKTYEEFASSDSLFAKACDKFRLAEVVGTPCTESFKRSVLKVSKVKDTKVLRVSVTLPNPEQAQALVQYLAEQTVQLNQSLAQEGDRETLNDIRKQLATASVNLERVRKERDAASATGSEATLAEQVNNLSDLIGRTDIELMRSKIDLAEEVARGDKTESATVQARVAALTQQGTDYARRRDAASAALAIVNARQDRADQALKTAQTEFDSWTRRVNETDAATGSRTERLRVIDPGIVPQQRSFPNPPLFIGVAFLISAVLALTLLTLRYGLQRQRLLLDQQRSLSPRRELVEIGPDSLPNAGNDTPKEIRITRSANR